LSNINFETYATPDLVRVNLCVLEP